MGGITQENGYLMSFDDFIRLGAGAGALGAIGLVLGWTFKKVVLPMWNSIARAFRRLDRAADEVNGRPEERDPLGNLLSPEITPLRAELQKLLSNLAEQRIEIAAIRADLDTHVQWHPSPSGQPASGRIPKRRGNGRE